MALMADEIAAYLAAQGHGTTAAPTPTIVIGRLEASPDNVVCLTPTYGRRAERVMGQGAAGVVYDQPHLQVMVRDTNSTTCETRATAIHALLDGFTGELSGTRYHYIEAMHPPAYVSIDENRRTLFSINFHIRRARV